MQSIDFEEILDGIVERDPRYHRDAYHFLREALDHTHKAIAKAHRHERRHVSGGELLEGIRQYALDQFGPMTLMVLDEWGVRVTEDFGNLVFNLVDSKFLCKTEEDSIEDFKNCYDFTEAFEAPFRPSSPDPDLPPPNRMEREKPHGKAD